MNGMVNGSVDIDLSVVVECLCVVGFVDIGVFDDEYGIVEGLSE